MSFAIKDGSLLRPASPCHTKEIFQPKIAARELSGEISPGFRQENGFLYQPHARPRGERRWIGSAEININETAERFGATRQKQWISV